MPHSTFDVKKARAETPGCLNRIHFNNAGAALMPRAVLDSMVNHLNLEAEIGGYEAAEYRQEAVQYSYAACARLVNAHPDEIAVVENATRAWDMIFYSIPFKPGDRILTSMAEYASNFIAYLQQSRRLGVRIDVVPNDEHDQLSVSALAEMMDDDVRLVTITHVPTNGGLVNPAEEIGAVLRGTKALYLLDACQSVGQMDVDVKKIGCHFLSTTARKYLRGPRGIGFLYVAREQVNQLEPPFLDLHAASWTQAREYRIEPNARRFENWEANYAAKIGLGKAVDYAMSWGIPAIRERVFSLAALLREKLASIPGVQVTDAGAVRCGIVTFKVEGRDSIEVRQQFYGMKVNVSTSSVFSTRLDMEKRNLDCLVRASLHYYNTEEEMDSFCEMLEGMKSK